ncbi:MAG: hypothetical protein A2W31_11995 [Planctomycetes bacterium RBG_16_64_10]|nr:MAG: hypothetical protein A2W31_11995 [Planctomycetes bacterium RBG_16_64_10]
MPKATAGHSGKNWLLISLRQWHSWGGLFVSLLILLVAVTGILLNHKDTFLHGGEKKDGPTGLLTSTTDFKALPIAFDRALEIAREHYGEVSLEKIELKDERGWLVYKVSRGHGEEIRIDACTGEASSKYGLSLKSNGETALNWAKIAEDLHTGKIFGTVGKLAVDLTSGAIIALSLTGIYLWGMPLLRKRRNTKSRQASAVLDPR